MSFWTFAIKSWQTNNYATARRGFLQCTPLVLRTQVWGSVIWGIIRQKLRDYWEHLKCHWPWYMFSKSSCAWCRANQQKGIFATDNRLHSTCGGYSCYHIRHWYKNSSQGRKPKSRIVQQMQRYGGVVSRMEYKLMSCDKLLYVSLILPTSKCFTQSPLAAQWKCFL